MAASAAQPASRQSASKRFRARSEEKQRRKDDKAALRNAKATQERPCAMTSKPDAASRFMGSLQGSWTSRSELRELDCINKRFTRLRFSFSEMRQSD
jgi:hypothetical protein